MSSLTDKANVLGDDFKTIGNSSTSNEIIMSAKNCNVYYGDNQALKNITLDVGKSEVLALIGPSGCGKTTLLRIIAGLEEPDEGGKIIFNKENVTDLQIEKRNVGMVFQSYALFPNMNVKENIGYGLKVRKLDKNKIDDRVSEMLEMMHINDLSLRRIDQLSGGQRQRIAIARALIRNPRILILDEATSALDTVSETKVQEALNHLMKDRTTFVIAHRLSTVQNADKIVVLKEGRVEQIGRHEELIKGDGLYRELYDPEWAKKRNRDREERIRKIAEAV